MPRPLSGGDNLMAMIANAAARSDGDGLQVMEELEALVKKTVPEASLQQVTALVEEAMKSVNAGIDDLTNQATVNQVTEALFGAAPPALPPGAATPPVPAPDVVPSQTPTVKPPAVGPKTRKATPGPTVDPRGVGTIPIEEARARISKAAGGLVRLGKTPEARATLRELADNAAFGMEPLDQLLDEVAAAGHAGVVESFTKNLGPSLQAVYGEGKQHVSSKSVDSISAALSQIGKAPRAQMARDQRTAAKVDAVRAAATAAEEGRRVARGGNSAADAAWKMIAGDLGDPKMSRFKIVEQAVRDGHLPLEEANNVLSGKTPVEAFQQMLHESMLKNTPGPDTTFVNATVVDQEHDAIRREGEAAERRTAQEAADAANPGVFKRAKNTATGMFEEAKAAGWKKNLAEGAGIWAIMSLLTHANQRLEQVDQQKRLDLSNPARSAEQILMMLRDRETLAKHQEAEAAMAQMQQSQAAAAQDPTLANYETRI